MEIPQSEFRIPKYEEMTIFAREGLGLSESSPMEVLPFGKRGSDRTYYRLKWNRGDSAILVHYDPKYVENAYYADIGIFLKGIEIPVPRLIRHDPVRCLIVMEDLGDTDLWSLRGFPWEARQSLYQKTLTLVHRLHSFPEENFPSDHVKLTEAFSFELYRWERDYFKEEFVKGFCGVEIKPAFGQELEEELSALAEHLIGTKRCLVHRDFQSQNVMIREGEPFLIDFQGMRFGSPFYDLGSMLCDPYVEFDDGQRMELIHHYYKLSHENILWEDFQEVFWEASAQRLMQALGAYGFLGLKKGLKTFLDHIPSGLGNLRHAAAQVPFLSRLRELSEVCQISMTHRPLPPSPPTGKSNLQY